MKTKLIPCKSCEAMISKAATKCPQCGKTYTSLPRLVLLAVVAVFICWFLGAFEFLKYL